MLRSIPAPIHDPDFSGLPSARNASLSDIAWGAENHRFGQGSQAVSNAMFAGLERCFASAYGVDGRDAIRAEMEKMRVSPENLQRELFQALIRKLSLRIQDARARQLFLEQSQPER